MKMIFTSRRLVPMVAVAALCSIRAIAVPPGYGVGGFPNDPYGDVDGNGTVDALDVSHIATYSTFPSAFTEAQQDRIHRFGDVAGVVNRTTIGNGVVDMNDVLRHALMTGGILDAGTAGPDTPAYGDVNGDGKVDIVDTVIMARSVHGLKNPAYEPAVNTKGKGDISPTIPYISFGDGKIDSADVATATLRSTGSEPNPPAYVDYWPLHCPNFDHPEVPADVYQFTDITGRSGDSLHQITYVTSSCKEVRGYTVTEVVGTDGSLIGAFKGIDGSIYALYVQYPVLFNQKRVDFLTPIKILDSKLVNTGGTFSGKVFGDTHDSQLGIRPVPYTVTVLGNGDVYTPASGQTSLGAPRTPWAKTVQLRIDIALIARYPGDIEMQQAVFYNLAPFIGVVNRAQAAVRGSAAPTLDRPYLRLDNAVVRGIPFGPNTPNPATPGAP